MAFTSKIDFYNVGSEKRHKVTGSSLWMAFTSKIDFYNVGNGIICNDIDECLTSNGGCDNNAMCSNELGSRTCTCKMGYTGNGTYCENIDECLTNDGGCSSNANCTDTMGSRACQCNSGYTGINII